MTFFKPGDIVVHNHNEKVVYLILKVEEENDEDEQYKIFVLNHGCKDWIGSARTFIYSRLGAYILLKDAKLNDF